MQKQVAIRRIATWTAAGVAVAFFIWNIARFFPNPYGGLGNDYSLFLPWMLAAFFWRSTNGLISPVDFVPSFCGGVPLGFNPQGMVFSLPQWLLAILPPVQSLLVSWIAFGLIGGVGMYALLRRVFRVSEPAAMLGAVLFLLNGFYTTRMIVGHATYHGIMLLPAIALAIFTASAAAGRPRWPARAGRCASTGLLLAYLFLSGGTNIILPILLALVLLALLVRYLGRWNADIALVAGVGCVLAFGLCAYKFFPAMAYAAHVTRPLALRMTPDLLALVGAVAVALFVPQALAYLDPDRLVVERVELEYGVGVVPLLVLVVALVVAIRRGTIRRAAAGRIVLVGSAAILLIIPILVNYDGPGLRWLLLQTPVVRLMSVMLRFWFVYTALLCVVTALLLDDLVTRPGRRTVWGIAAVALTIAQSAATDMTYYAAQPYGPGSVAAAYQAVRRGDPVPAITRIDRPPLLSTRDGLLDRPPNDGLVDGISDLPCYEPMFGYRLNVFVTGHLTPGPVLAARDGRLNLKNPACYVFPAANGCQPGDEFTVAQTDAARAFASYRPFAYRWPLWEYAAAAASVVSATLCLLLLMAWLWSVLAGRRA